MKKHRIRIKRRDGIRQRYWVGRKLRKNYGMAIIPMTSVPVVDHPEQYNSIKKKVIVNMSPQKYFDILQKAIIKKMEVEDPPEAERFKNESPEEFRNSLGGMYERDIKEKMRKLKRGEDVNTGYIELGKYIDSKGKVHPTVEFDTPGGIEAARRLGIPEVPVVLLEGRSAKFHPGKIWPEWEFSPMELAKKEDEEGRTIVTGIERKDTNKANINIIHTKILKKGAQPGSKYESDYEDEPRDTWRDVITLDLRKV